MFAQVGHKLAEVQRLAAGQIKGFLRAASHPQAGVLRLQSTALQTSSSLASFSIERLWYRALIGGPKTASDMGKKANAWF